jgi:tetraacyldisaccharide 4'-kinase
MLEKVILAPYYGILKLRHFLYDKGIFKVSTSEVPTICVGNITAGGTGKTPHTEMILRYLLHSDDWAYSNIAELSRGHKRLSGGFQIVSRDGNVNEYGDEALQIKKKFPSVTVAVDRRRVEGCDLLTHPEKIRTSKRARSCANEDVPKADIIVLDDSFQYRSLNAYYKIILVDYNSPTYKDRLLPFGRLRDLPERLVCADILIVTKCPVFVPDEERLEWAKNFGIKDFDLKTCTGIDRKGMKKTLLFTSINYKPLEPVYDQADNRYSYSKHLILFSGIAKDTPLRRYLSDNYKIVKRFTFMDHHNYNRWDIRKIMRAVKENPTAVVATTEKDCQRIMDYKKIPDMLKERLFKVPIEVGFLTEEEKSIFENTLATALRNFHKDY